MGDSEDKAETLLLKIGGAGIMFTLAISCGLLPLKW